MYFPLSQSFELIVKLLKSEQNISDIPNDLIKDKRLPLSPSLLYWHMLRKPVCKMRKDVLQQKKSCISKQLCQVICLQGNGILEGDIDAFNMLAEPPLSSNWSLLACTIAIVAVILIVFLMIFSRLSLCVKDSSNSFANIMTKISHEMVTGNRKRPR